MKQLPEIGAIRKKWGGKLPIALLYPNTYRLGMSNLGFQLVYHLLNKESDFACERVFLPDSGDDRPLSVESGRPLSDFPLILCSVSFEQDYVNLLSILIAAGIEPRAGRRAEQGPPGPGTPLILGGGVATFINPEPLAPVFDLIYLGEAEAGLVSLMASVNQSWQAVSRRQLLSSLASRAGCYIPSLYDLQYDHGGICKMDPVEEGVPPRVARVRLKGTELAGHSRLLTPETEFSDLFLAELGRGCSRGCRFCAAGFVYRPPRLWSAEAILKALAARPEGIKRVGLLGMEMARGEDLSRVASYLLVNSCALSFSSLRADAITPELARILKESKIKSAAIAPDGGSPRLRKVINKGITEEDVLTAARLLVDGGVTNLKLYFMIGLPTETEEDLDQLVELALRVRDEVDPLGRRRGYMTTITLSINPFVPKAWTPFQFCAFAGVSRLKKKIKYVRKQLSGAHHIRIRAEKPDHGYFQAVLARGDRRLFKLLLAMAGSRRNWRQLAADLDIDLKSYIKERSRDQISPWDIIDQGISRDYLWAEHERALAGRKTPPCQPEICSRCGVCDGKG